MNKLETSKHRGARNFLRAAGLLTAAVGLVFLVVGMASFFSAFGGGGSPRLFWCCFVGMPLLFAGGVMCMFGFMGAVARYTAAEQVPVATDAVNELAAGTQGARQDGGARGSGRRARSAVGEEALTRHIGPRGAGGDSASPDAWTFKLKVVASNASSKFRREAVARAFRQSDFLRGRFCEPVLESGTASVRLRQQKPPAVSQTHSGSRWINARAS